MGVHIPCPIDMFFSLKKPTWFWTDFFFGFESTLGKTCDVFWRGKNRSTHHRRWAGKISNTIWVRLVGFPPRTRLGIFWWSYIGLRLNLENRCVYIYIYLWSSHSFFCWHLCENKKNWKMSYTGYTLSFSTFFLGGLKGQPGRRSDFLFLKWRFFDASGCHVPSGHAGRSLKYRGAAEGLFSATAPKEIRWKDMGVSKNKGTRTPKWMVGWYRAKFSLPREVRQH